MKNAITSVLAITLASGGVVALAYEQGDWVVRVGAATVDPDTRSDNINLPAGLVAQADVDLDTQLGITPSYAEYAVVSAGWSKRVAALYWCRR
jgi:outer membrane protein